MYQLKGFVNVKALNDNAVGIVSPIGEISTWSMTYTRDHGEYESDASPGYRLLSISSTDSVKGRIPLDIKYADHVLEVSKWIFDHLENQILPINRTAFSEDLVAQFNNIISNVSFGALITDGSNSLPEWISWKNIVLPDNDLKVWFSDISFSEQFDESELVVIPPIPNLDDFFMNPNLVKAKVESIPVSDYMDTIQGAKGKTPETVIRTGTYPYINPSFPGIVVQTNWSVLIYGQYGDNINTIKDATIAYILKNSKHTREEWTVLLPDLFKRTEFIILPRWDKYAIPNKTVQAGLYSPISNVKESVAFTKSKIPEYAPAHIDANIEIFNHPYRSLTMTSIGGIDNKDNKYSITDHFPDFINVGTDSLDFNRMELVTQNWSYLMEQLLITAEHMGIYSTLPSNMRRIKRGNMLYLVAVYQNIQYLVAAKLNYGI